jgi:hypothetical protein
VALLKLQSESEEREMVTLLSLEPLKSLPSNNNAFTA